MDENIINQSLRKVSKGAGIFIVGTIIGLGFALLSKIILARFLSIDDFGIYNIAITILLVTTNLGVLGLTSGIPRMMGYYKGKKNYTNLNRIQYFTMKIFCNFHAIDNPSFKGYPSKITCKMGEGALQYIVEGR